MVLYSWNVCYLRVFARLVSSKTRFVWVSVFALFSLLLFIVFCAAYLHEVHCFVFAKLHLTQHNTRI